MSSGSCRACAADKECASGVCDIDSGECLPESSVLYVETTGVVSTPCGERATPCRSIGLAVPQLGPSHPALHLGPGLYDESIQIRGVDATIVGDGAIVDPAAQSQAGLDVADAAGLYPRVFARSIVFQGATYGVSCVGSGASFATVRLRDVEVNDNLSRGVSAESGGCDIVFERSKAQNNAATGLIAAGGSKLAIFDSQVLFNNAGVSCFFCQLTIERSQISARTGGVGGTRWALQAASPSKLRVVNNLIFGYGVVGNDPPIILLDYIASGSVFEFNTIVSSLGGVLKCADQDPGFQLLVRNSILLAASGPTMTGSNCRIEYSLMIEADGGEGNLMGSAEFVNPGTDFRLQPLSPARNAANNTEGINVDHDGRFRPNGREADMGAFEAP